MSFTDDNLKRLKERLADQKNGAALIPYGNSPLVFDCKTFLARLEAAEAVCREIEEHSYRFITENPKILINLELAWRKAAGK